MLAVPFLVMVASTRRGRLVLLTVLCVMVSAIRSSYHNGGDDSTFVSLGRVDWSDEYPIHMLLHSSRLNDSRETQRTFLWRQVQRLVQLRRPVRPFDYQAHLASVVSPEEVAHHLRQPTAKKSSASSNSWLSRVVAATPLLRQQRQKSQTPVLEGAVILDESPSESSASSSLVPQDVILQSLTEPLMLQSVWNSLTGREFQEYPELVHGLAGMGERLVRSPDGNGWIDWKEYGKHSAFDEQDCETVQVWTGRATRAEQYHGADVPFIKSKSRIPLSPVELKDLLLDSSRIKTYNPWSTGRQDCWISSESSEPHGRHKKSTDVNANMVTKIVKNMVQPPVGSALVGVTLLHARPLDQGSWLVVSRSVGGQAYFNEHDLASAGRSDILLGVNLIEPVADDDDACIMTSITHAASSSVPSMLAERFGVKGAVKFVQDIRKLKVPA